MSEKLIGVVRVRGIVGINPDIKKTMELLNLHRVNYCSVHKDTPIIRGMLAKAKDYITWGELDEATLKSLLDKRAEKNPKDEKRTKKFFRLNSPKKGYGRKGIKVPFSKKGALGDRKADINDLIVRML